MPSADFNGADWESSNPRAANIVLDEASDYALEKEELTDILFCVLLFLFVWNVPLQYRQRERS